MAILLSELLSRISPETEALVEQTRRRFNLAVRQTLRAETGLRLSNFVTGEKGEERETTAIRVFNSPGMPEELKDLEFSDDLWLAIELAPLKGLLETSNKSMVELSKPIERLSKRLEFENKFPEAVSAIVRVRDLTKVLLTEAAKFNLLEKIFAVNKDIMGLYSYRLPSDPSLFSDDLPPRVCIRLPEYFPCAKFFAASAWLR